MSGNFFHSKAFIFGLLIIFILVVIAAGREGYRNYKIGQEIKALQKKIDDLSKTNADLSEMEKYLQSDEFLEKEARLKLNLIREGENLVIIKRSERTSVGPEESILQEENKEIPNIRKWQEYFFGENE